MIRFQHRVRLANFAPTVKPVVKNYKLFTMPKRSSTLAERVLEAVRQIPAGQTRSYQEVAALAGIPKGARFVARVMSQNYDPSVPCHRVIYSDGRIGNYNRGGEIEKRRKLQKEGWKGTV
jgi:O-6-methylguanine DNA methyltransferase